VNDSATCEHLRRSFGLKKRASLGSGTCEHMRRVAKLELPRYVSPHKPQSRKIARYNAAI
jgi:hypothetical protein